MGQCTPGPCARNTHALMNTPDRVLTCGLHPGVHSGHPNRGLLVRSILLDRSCCPFVGCRRACSPCCTHAASSRLRFLLSSSSLSVCTRLRISMALFSGMGRMRDTLFSKRMP